MNGLEEATALEVLADQQVGDDVEDEANVVRVGGTRQVGVDILAAFLI